MGGARTFIGSGQVVLVLSLDTLQCPRLYTLALQPCAVTPGGQTLSERLSSQHLCAAISDASKEAGSTICSVHAKYLRSTRAVQDTASLVDFVDVEVLAGHEVTLQHDESL